MWQYEYLLFMIIDEDDFGDAMELHLGLRLNGRADLCTAFQFIDIN